MTIRTRITRGRMRRRRSESYSRSFDRLRLKFCHSITGRRNPREGVREYGCMLYQERQLGPSCRVLHQSACIQHDFGQTLTVSYRHSQRTQKIIRRCSAKERLWVNKVSSRKVRRSWRSRRRKIHQVCRILIYWYHHLTSYSRFGDG